MRLILRSEVAASGSLILMLSAFQLFVVGNIASAQDTNENGGGTINSAVRPDGHDSTVDRAMPARDSDYYGRVDRRPRISLDRAIVEAPRPVPSRPADPVAVQDASETGGGTIATAPSAEAAASLSNESHEYVNRQVSRQREWHNHQRYHRVCRSIWRHHHRTRNCRWRVR